MYSEIGGRGSQLGTLTFIYRGAGKESGVRVQGRCMPRLEKRGSLARNGESLRVVVNE